MTVDEVNAWVDEIRVSAGDDPEVAHSSEDYLHRSVLKAIAEGASEPEALAAAALNSQAIDFPRWCA